MTAEARDQVLRIDLLGRFRVTYGAKLLATVEAPRLRSLLAYLLLHRDAPTSRHRLAFLFWPDSPEEQALTNLRNLLYRLRHSLPDSQRFVAIDRRTLLWRVDAPFECDVVDFEEALHRMELASDEDALRETLEDAVSLYGGDLLPGSYEDWMVPERQRLRQAFQRALEQLIDLLEDQQDYRDAIDHARSLVRHDPLREASYRRLMRLYALIGDRARALRTYHRCATVLERELDVEPGPATRGLYERLLAANQIPRNSRTGPKDRGGVSRLVGREDAWARLMAAWREARSGRPHIALVSGEPGIGKTRLAEELVQWANRLGFSTASARCYGAEGELAFAPVAAWIRSRPLPPVDPMWRTEIARIVPEVLAEDPELPGPGPVSEPWQRRRFFEALARVVLSTDQPMLLLIDALEWCDRGTVEWLHYLLRYDPRAQLLLVGTYRPDQVHEDHALSPLVGVLRRDEQVTEIDLGPLSRDETATLAENIAGRELDPAVAKCLFRETEGNPLFIVETVRGGLPQSTRKLPSGARVCVPRPLPSRIRDALMARIGSLSPLSRSLAELAAVIGREFSFDVLREASDTSEDRLVQGLDELWHRRIVREQGEDGYDFSHDKLREVLVDELSEARRRLLHRRVAGALEHIYAQDSDPVVARIASHYDQAGESEEAIIFYQHAAEVARRMQAEEVAARCLSHAAALADGRRSHEP